MGFFFARRLTGRASSEASSGSGRLGWAALTVSVALLSACASTGESFNTAGLNRIVAGRTTLEQASGYLGAAPADVWRQGDSTLARWAYKGTIATDAVYFRQEAWLRFGPDGTFQRMENSVNLPLNRRPRTAEEADREARAEQDRIAHQAVSGQHPKAGAEAATVEEAGGAMPVAVPAAETIQPASLAIPPSATPPAASPSVQSARPVRGGRSSRTGRTASAKKPTAPGTKPVDNPLLPAGTKVIPGVTYPLQKKNP
ncbi:hypothetical protein [Castellaniella denitrificans]|uniref:Lipoprotein n=1 Tax=Castellaniella denitrificans TaxID=56119 RepID=A0ABT4M5Q3_9BURK|nr:hypothetical protein [Castellaniella denitrificans]MCZ4330642.1 hypothetical protein [Castellaniella denitrificans]